MERGGGLCMCVEEREPQRDRREATDDRGGCRRKIHSERISKATSGNDRSRDRKKRGRRSQR